MTAKDAVANALAPRSWYAGRMTWTLPHSMRLLVTVVALVPSLARADYFVITATQTSKDAAQKQAAERGGWVLDTNLYPGLVSNKYAVVRGPFLKGSDARKALDDIR